ncbi:hypothetical protein JAAARDRAFT_154101 [Jaapia argillacea MUCL 33604]|uniref:Uncharacterized protein n=1 Tax=Jaapia argillacea MUCL 33604 TaxID=933084 RepID=A0A067Q8P2_9AGAM|nr:hypothetical protein JAAARDRAFT_154101 [Jaapia argillacea MUCL 33604]
MFRPASIRSALRARITQAESRRFASSSTESAQKKTQDFLATAQKYASQGLETAGKLLGPVGEKAGNLLGGYRQPLLYNLSVTREILKQVYVAERLQPPTSLGTIGNAYSTIFARARNPAYWREILNNGDWAKLSVYAAEAYGIFKIGEILGRRSLVGYNVQ